jgi:hypothetical protein
LAPKVRHDSRVHLIAFLPSLIHCSYVPRTTKLYDRTGDEITLDEVERIAI